MPTATTTAMTTATTTPTTTPTTTFSDAAAARYAKTIEVSRRVRWEIERDVIRGREFDLSREFLPRGLSLAGELGFLTAAERRLFSQVQGRTYAGMFGLVERFITAKAMQLCERRALGDQVALEALLRMADEEVKHQALFRRLEEMMDADMPAGYRMTADPDAVARAVLAQGDWAVLALTLDIELFSQAHYRASIDPSDGLCPLWKDVFLFHWREESQHAILDELEFLAEDARVSPQQRDAGVDQLIGLVGAVDGIVQAQAAADAQYFARIAPREFDPAQREAIAATLLKAYRWQYIVSGAMEPRFQKTLFGCLDGAQTRRIQDALAPLAGATPAQPEMALPMAA